MGQGQSGEQSSQHVSTEQLSHELAGRFATRCFTPLELTHFKDNFRTLADSTDGLKYWKEETLCRFLCLPDALSVGPVIFHMVSYLGAFPFPSLAPSILTLESLVKVVVIMTERYGKVLKRGRRDRGKLLFRSLAIFDRRMTGSGEEKPKLERDIEKEVERLGSAIDETTRNHVDGFAVDQAANDDEEDEDDDELALAALDSLDAIEVFRHDQRPETKMHHALIPTENLLKLIMLMLLMAPLGPQDHLATYAKGLTEEKLGALRKEADYILAAFHPDPNSGGINYRSFMAAASRSLPHLFDPLNAVFEHFLFSKNMDLSRKRASSAVIPATEQPGSTSEEEQILPADTPESAILTLPLLGHLSFFLPTESKQSLFHNNTRFHLLYATATHGTSLTSFSRQVLSWQSPTLLLLSGTSGSSSSDNQTPSLTLGAYLPMPWKSSKSDSPETMLFLLSPSHATFPAASHHSTPFHHFNVKSGICFGCTLPPSSRTVQHPIPIPGPVSLFIDTDLEKVTFTHSHEPGSAFNPSSSSLDLLLPSALRSQQHNHNSPGDEPNDIKVELDLDGLEVWGLSVPTTGVDEVTKQQERLQWEEREAERRARVNFGGDRDGARALLEMAGIVGQHSGQGRSGGSI